MVMFFLTAVLLIVMLVCLDKASRIRARMAQISLGSSMGKASVLADTEPLEVPRALSRTDQLDAEVRDLLAAMRRSAKRYTIAGVLVFVALLATWAIRIWVL